MQLPDLTPDQIRHRCTAQSWTRGTEYFHTGAIGNPVLHGYTLSATCQGTEITPYRVSVELMPTGIVLACCSCPYSGEGDCKHIVALLLTYLHTPKVICSVDALLITLAEKPKAHLLRVISELLKRTPALAPVARVYADLAAEAGLEMAPTTPKPTVGATIGVYREQIDRLFGNGFLEQHSLQQVLIQLEGLITHADSLAQGGETAFALAILHALIHQSINRYADTLQRGELPGFVKTCAKRFVDIATEAQANSSGNPGPVPETLDEHCRLLLDLSFKAEPVFTPILTGVLEHVSLRKKPLQAEIEQRLDESPDRRAHVQLLLTLYFHAGATEAYLRLARAEGEGYRLIHHLFTLRRDDAAWEALETFPLSVEECESLLKSPILTRAPYFAERLLMRVRKYPPDTAIPLYQRLIEQTVLSRKREAYEKVLEYLTELKTLYQHLDQENQWGVYLTHFRKQHVRKRLLLDIIEDETR